jgi:lysozyme
LDIAIGLCKRFEGLYLRPYLCPAGVPTIGYGTTRYENGRPVALDDPLITVQRAEGLLLWELTHAAAPAVQRLCPTLAADSPAAYNAIVDFTYNLGAGRLQTSTLRRTLNARDWPAARAQLALWVRGGGRVLPGLVARRRLEAALLPV